MLLDAMKSSSKHDAINKFKTLSQNNLQIIVPSLSPTPRGSQISINKSIVTLTNNNNDHEYENHTKLPHMQPSLNTEHSLSISKDITDISKSHTNNIMTKQELLKLHVKYLRNEQLKRRSIVILVSSIFIIFSLILSIYIIQHFNYTNKICKQTKNDVIIDNNNNIHYEMNVWNYCEDKVFPLLFNYNEPYLPCNCRQLIIDENDFEIGTKVLFF